MKRDDDYGKRDDSYRGGRDRSASPNGRVDSRYAHYPHGHKHMSPD